MVVHSVVFDRNFRRVILTAILGLLICGVSIYAGYLFCGQLNTEKYSVFNTSGIRGFLEYFYDNFKFFASAFLAGFTIFAPALCSFMLLWRSAEFGGALRIFMSGASADKAAFVSLVISGALLLLFYSVALASVIHSKSLKYAVPELSELTAHPETRGFFKAFVVSGAVLLFMLIIRYFTLRLLMQL